MPGAKNVKSSLVKTISYNKREQNLKVRFVNNGETVNYVYHKVPENIYKDFMAAESHGKFFLANVKDKYNWTKAETFLISDAAKLDKKMTENPEPKEVVTTPEETPPPQAA